MRKQLSVCLIIAVAALGSCKKNEMQTVMSIASAVGDVKLVTAQGDKNPQAGDAVAQGDMIVTGKSSLVDILYSTRGLIRISENSQVRISLLAFDSEKENSRLAMNKGKLFVTISKLTKNSSFEVSSSTAVAAVRGTSLSVIADEKSSRIVVLKGKVSVQPVKEGKVIEASESTVETHQAVELSTEVVEQISEKKAQIQVVMVKDAEVKEIQREIRDIQETKAVQRLDPEVQQEAREVVVSAPADAAVGDKAVEQKRLDQERQRREKIERDRREREQKAREQSAVEQKSPESKRGANIPSIPNM